MTDQCSENYGHKMAEGFIRSLPTTSEEYGLLVAAKSGNPAALDALCKQSANMVFNIARRMMRSNEDAEDIVQESFKQAFIHLKRFKGDSRFSTWLIRIAINASLMRLRKKRVWREVSLDERLEAKQWPSQPDIQDQRPDPEELYAQKERSKILSDAIDKLAPRTRRAIQLRELDERSTDETARIVGISKSAVKARLFHGRRELRRMLNSHAMSKGQYRDEAPLMTRRPNHNSQIVCGPTGQGNGEDSNATLSGWR